jgi:hypothetical protein
VAAAGLAAWRWLAMSVVTKHLERASRVEVLPHRQADTSAEKARVLGSTPVELLRLVDTRNRLRLRADR